MIRHYIKSAMKQAKADKVFTAIYIAGVTLAIATTMTMAIVYYIKIAPIYPEKNRQETYYITGIICKSENFHNQSNLSYSFIKNELAVIPEIKALGASSDVNGVHGVILPDGQQEIKVQVKNVDAGFFKVYDFNFMQGEPFTVEDIDGGVDDVVISDQMARMVYGDDNDIIGKTICLDNVDYRVKGVVESASPLTGSSFAQIYIPAEIKEKELSGEINERLSGNYNAVALIDKENEGIVKEQIAKRLNALADGTDWELSIYEAQPISHVKNVLVPYAQYFSWWNALKNNMLILLVVLIVPALNLSGLISGRMDARVGELGLRKAFGAERKSIMMLVLTENLVYTLIGGLIGLIVSYIVMFVGNYAVVGMFTDNFGVGTMADSVSMSVRPEMFLSFTVFGITLGVCIILNVISAMIPASLSMRHKIVESLNEKK